MKSNFTLSILVGIAWVAYAMVAAYLIYALATNPAHASVDTQLAKCVQIPDLRINDDHVTVKLICDDTAQQCVLVEIVHLEPKNYFSPLSTECSQ